MATKLIFYFFAATLTLAAFRVITARNPVHAALFLVLAFFSSAAIWLLLQAEFLAITLILVYVGAVMILFLFVVMMLDINLAPLREGFAKYLPVGFAVSILILIEMIMVVSHWKTGLATTVTATNIPNVEQLGQLLYSAYLYPFEIAALILLVAMVAAIALTMRPHTRAKYQKPEQQVRVRREDRLRLISLPAEPKD